MVSDVITLSNGDNSCHVFMVLPESGAILHEGQKTIQTEQIYNILQFITNYYKFIPVSERKYWVI